MPGVFILTVFPTLLVGALLIIMAGDLSGAASISMGLLVMLLGVVFVSLAMAMRRQHPSQDAGDRRLAEDRFPRFADPPDLSAIPEAIEEEITTRLPALERWTDDGAPGRAN